MHLNQQKIVITGGPSTGKTSLINALEKNGYHCFQEVIRLMTLEAKKKGDLGSLNTNPIATVSDPTDFNKKIINARLAHFREAKGVDEPVVFFDRGIPDVLAYMDYFNQEYDSLFTQIAENNRYDAVFLLPIWEEIYVVDGERFETYEEALAIHDQLYDTYTKLGYNVIEVPKDTVQNRIEFMLKQIERD